MAEVESTTFSWFLQDKTLFRGLKNGTEIQHSVEIQHRGK